VDVTLGDPSDLTFWHDVTPSTVQRFGKLKYISLIFWPSLIMSCSQTQYECHNAANAGLRSEKPDSAVISQHIDIEKPVLLNH